MAKISWLPSFETGISEIDNDHKGLVEAIQGIEVALDAGDTQTSANLFKDFLDQAAAHFKREEAYLISIDFPRLESHSSDHKRLMEMGGDTLKKVNAGMTPEETRSCLEEMIYFLLEDVIKADAEFKSYAQERGII